MPSSLLSYTERTRGNFGHLVQVWVSESLWYHQSLTLVSCLAKLLLPFSFLAV